jgi:isoamylase
MIVTENPTISAARVAAHEGDTPSRAGTPYPQGATWDGKGVNFSLFSASSEAIDLCLFDNPDHTAESQRVRIRERTNGVWHIYIPKLRPGQLYGYRVHGPYEPNRGLRFNPNKLLLDPYAKAIGRELNWADEVFGYKIGDPQEDLSFDDRDSAAFAPLGVVTDSTFDWGDEKRPNVSWSETVIYEAHVRGLTKLHPHIPENIRGTYKAMASDPVIKHLKALGVTTVELMPVHHFLHDRHLLEKGLRNYWGYNTLGFFAPEASYSSDRNGVNAVWEFKEMVKRLHNAGFEVVLDVVYNHTAEGNHAGPTLSFRGIDNLAYYRTVAEDPRYYMDYTGCGNTLNMVTPHSLQFLMDSLRYWVTEMHIDGFRFDLASALARELKEVNQLGPFFDTLYQDPTLATTKLIAEPWDLGEGGYQVGNFPVRWTEWNGRYRDCVRKYWKGDMGLHSEIATRLQGSADLYEHTGRLPSASINFVTAHDGFTLNDLVTYQEKHNEANLDDNRDGTDDNNAWNCGAEGPTEDPAIIELREQQKRNLWSTLLFSQGVPMICSGDEYGRTQRGNNNAYCQDNELAWFDWKWDERRTQFFDFARKVVGLRRNHPSFRRRRYKNEDPTESISAGSVRWFRADGKDMQADDWENGGWMRTLGMFLDGNAPEIRDPDGLEVQDNNYLLLLNAHHEPVVFKIPHSLSKCKWKVELDTAQPKAIEGTLVVRRTLKIEGRSLMLLVAKILPGTEPPAGKRSP